MYDIFRENGLTGISGENWVAFEEMIQFYGEILKKLLGIEKKL